MRDRGKGLEQFNGDSTFINTSLELPCRKHPSSSSYSSGGYGICAFCLQDRLALLVCPQCGEQRLPNCSCSEDQPPEILRRSNSICASSDVNSRGGGGRGFSKLKKMFRKKKEKETLIETEIRDSKSSASASASAAAVFQRSRSLCSFRGGGPAASSVGGGSLYYDNDEIGWNQSGARASSVSNLGMESAKMSCFSESEARMSNFEYERDLTARGIFPMREGYEFSSGEDPKFIDLKMDSPGGYRRGSREFYGGGEDTCRFSNVSENEMRKCRKGRKGWRWFFKG